MAGRERRVLGCWGGGVCWAVGEAGCVGLLGRHAHGDTTCVGLLGRHAHGDTTCKRVLHASSHQPPATTRRHHRHIHTHPPAPVPPRPAPPPAPPAPRTAPSRCRSPTPPPAGRPARSQSACAACGCAPRPGSATQWCAAALGPAPQEKSGKPRVSGVGGCGCWGGGGVRTGSGGWAIGIRQQHREDNCQISLLQQRHRQRHGEAQQGLPDSAARTCSVVGSGSPLPLRARCSWAWRPLPWGVRQLPHPRGSACAARRQGAWVGCRGRLTALPCGCRCH